MPVRPTAAPDRVAALRRFNRRFTATIGALGESYLASPFSLTETRVLYEIAHRDAATASDIVHELRLDAGYLSRLLARLARRGLVRRARARDDRRRTLLSLTRTGAAAFRRIDRSAAHVAASLLAPLADAEQRRLVDAAATIETLLGAPPDDPPFTLREPRPGDLGWVVERHGALYAREYGWDVQCEAFIAEIVAKFARHHDPQRERCWIAERHGSPVGSVFVMTRSPKVAQLRLLLVEPEARGLGIGQRLVDECIRFARGAGYRCMTLWTNDVLVSARRIYEGAGFTLVHEGPHHSFGQDLVEQVWEREL